MSTPAPVLGETLVESASIRRRVAELAADIDRHYEHVDRPIVLLCVLKGSLIFTSDLARALSVPLEIDCVAVRSYGAATVSTGRIELVMEPSTSLTGRDVLIVEDIVDTGTTIAYLQAHLAAAAARSVRVVALLNKTARREHPLAVDWLGFDIPDRFVVGYGLDYGERFRNLADVRALLGV
ncbi:MAG: hypoxanthine phosphoribosyltransferase [Candidatus Dormibacter sp.]